MRITRSASCTAALRRAGRPYRIKPNQLADSLMLSTGGTMHGPVDHLHPALEKLRADYLVNTVGYLVRRSPRFVSVAQEILPDGDGFRAVTHIPVAVVQTIAPLSDSDGPGMDDVLAL